MKVSGADVRSGASNNWEGADDAPWGGVAFKEALGELGLTLVTRKIKCHGDLERYLLSEVTGNVAAKGCMEPQEVLLVASWKSDRSLPCIAMNERVQGTLATKTKDTFADGLTTTDRVRRLCAIHGVGVGVASALLTVFRPEEFSVADWRALQTLKSHDDSAAQVGFADHADAWWYRHYDLYVEGCNAIARRAGVSLRDLDRSLEMEPGPWATRRRSR